MYQSIRLALLPLVIVFAVAEAPGHAQSPAPALLQQVGKCHGRLNSVARAKDPGD